MRGAAFVLALCAPLVVAAQASKPAAAPMTAPQPLPDGRHDFDFEIGTWTTHLKRLDRPLSGSSTWLEYNGSTSVSGILNGRSNLAELVVEGPSGRIEGASLRLYEPAARQWTLNFFTIADGRLTAPMTGHFRDGRGEFYGLDTFNGRSILVRFEIIKVSADVYRFEQAFSVDGGTSWELNWVAVDTRRPN
jgi:hypothetical protein